MKRLAERVDEMEVALIHGDLATEKDAKYAKLINDGGAKATLQKYKEGRKLTILFYSQNIGKNKAANQKTTTSWNFRAKY